VWSLFLRSQETSQSIGRKQLVVLQSIPKSILKQNLLKNCGVLWIPYLTGFKNLSGIKKVLASTI